MGNWVIHESICRSKSLRQCSGLAQDNFFRFILYADGYGCFKIDLDDMKVNLFRYRKGVGVKTISQLLFEYQQTGHLLLWAEKGKLYGFLLNWNEYSGRYLSRKGKRKTPEPPEKELEKYVDFEQEKGNPKPLSAICYKLLQLEGSSYKLKEVPTACRIE